MARNYILLLVVLVIFGVGMLAGALCATLALRARFKRDLIRMRSGEIAGETIQRWVDQL